MFRSKTAEQLAPINTVCLIILTTCAATGVLVYTKSILMPFVIALFFVMVMATIAKWMTQRWKTPYWVGLLSCFLAFLAITMLAFSFISNSIESFVNGAGIYTDRLNDSLDWVLAKANHYHININAEFVTEAVAKLPVFNMVKSVGSIIMSVFTNALLILLFVIFILMGKASDEKHSFVSSMQKQISFYLIVKISVSVLAAFCTWIVLTFVHTELASMLAVLTFILNFIPNIGPSIATVSPVPVLFLQYGFDWHIVFVLVFLIAIHFLIGNILETKWLGKGMDLDPVVVVASLIFWALVWGVMGALLAVPLTAIIKMVLEQNETTRPLAKILGGNFTLK